jgi:ABC-type uncharacterized transport system permease subunit
MLADTLFTLTALLYVGATAFFARYLSAPFDSRGGARAAEEGRRDVRLGTGLLSAATFFHAAHIVVFSLVLKACPVGGVHFTLSVTAMLSAVFFLAFRARFRLEAAGAMVAPFALAALLASRFVGGDEPSTRIRSTLLPFHVAFNLFGLALFSLACAAAALYLVQERLLKTKQIFGIFKRLPALDSLDRAEHRFLLAGFPLLTFGILSGSVWAQRIEQGSLADLLRAGFGWATWFTFAAVLLLRAAAGWRGRRAAWGTIIGFVSSLIVLAIYLVRSNGGAS